MSRFSYRASTKLYLYGTIGLCTTTSLYSWQTSDTLRTAIRSYNSNRHDNVLRTNLDSAVKSQTWVVKNLMCSRTNMSEGRYHTLITSAFNHGSLGHYLFNMVGLYSVGSLMVGILGNVAFVALFYGGAVAGNLLAMGMEDGGGGGGMLGRQLTDKVSSVSSGWFGGDGDSSSSRSSSSDRTNNKEHTSSTISDHVDVFVSKLQDFTNHTREITTNLLLPNFPTLFQSQQNDHNHPNHQTSTKSQIQTPNNQQEQQQQRIPKNFLGASGGVCALMSASAFSFPRLPMTILIVIFPVTLPNWAVALGFATFSAVAETRGFQTDVSHLGHLGGLMFGGMLYFVALRRKVLGLMMNPMGRF